MEHVRDAVSEALGSRLPIAFRGDVAVIAGIELHGRNTIVRNSWRADLDRIRTGLDTERHRRKT